MVRGFWNKDYSEKALYNLDQPQVSDYLNQNINVFLSTLINDFNDRILNCSQAEIAQLQAEHEYELLCAQLSKDMLQNIVSTGTATPFIKSIAVALSVKLHSTSLKDNVAALAYILGCSMALVNVVQGSALFIKALTDGVANIISTRNAGH